MVLGRHGRKHFGHCRKAWVQNIRKNKARTSKLISLTGAEHKIVTRALRDQRHAREAQVEPAGTSGTWATTRISTNHQVTFPRFSLSGQSLESSPSLHLFTQTPHACPFPRRHARVAAHFFPLRPASSTFLSPSAQPTSTLFIVITSPYRQSSPSVSAFHQHWHRGVEPNPGLFSLGTKTTRREDARISRQPHRARWPV